MQTVSHIALLTDVRPEANKGSGEFCVTWMSKLTHNTINMQKWERLSLEPSFCTSIFSPGCSGFTGLKLRWFALIPMDLSILIYDRIFVLMSLKDNKIFVFYQALF